MARGAFPLNLKQMPTKKVFMDNASMLSLVDSLSSKLETTTAKRMEKNKSLHKLKKASEVRVRKRRNDKKKELVMMNSCRI